MDEPPTPLLVLAYEIEPAEKTLVIEEAADHTTIWMPTQRPDVGQLIGAAFVLGCMFYGAFFKRRETPFFEWITVIIFCLGAGFAIYLVIKQAGSRERWRVDAGGIHIYWRGRFGQSYETFEFDRVREVIVFRGPMLATLRRSTRLTISGFNLDDGTSGERHFMTMRPIAEIERVAAIVRRWKDAGGRG